MHPKNLTLNPEEVHVWMVHLEDDFMDKLVDFTHVLSLEEYHQSMRFKFRIHKNNYIKSHLIKRLILSLYLKISPDRLQFYKSKLGKPFLYLSHNTDCIEYNLSHSHQTIVLAVTLKNPIGVDIQHHELDVSYQSIVSHYFSVIEKNHLQQISDKNRLRDAFFRIWARKEAFLKAVGCGIHLGLDWFSVDTKVDPSVPWLEIHDLNHASQAGWQLAAFDWLNSYQVAVVTKSSGKPSLHAYQLTHTVYFNETSWHELFVKKLTC